MRTIRSRVARLEAQTTPPRGRRIPYSYDSVVAELDPDRTEPFELGEGQIAIRFVAWEGGDDHATI
jgi:hypothetical protein